MYPYIIKPLVYALDAIGGAVIRALVWIWTGK